MSTMLEQAVTDYLVRRALGYKLVDNAVLLPDFVAYLQAEGASTVTSELALAWAIQPKSCTTVWWARRLAAARSFARHLRAIDPTTEVPPEGLLHHQIRRATPYLYSDADIAALMAAARQLASPQQAATYEALIGLLAVTGMRSGEAVRLDRDHIDWDEGVVVVRYTKFNKHRAVPLHATSFDALRRYEAVRDGYCPHPRSPAFFLSTAATRLDADGGLHHVWRRLVRAAGLCQPGRRLPRPHDLRHTFAVRTLVDWYRSGVDVEAHMPRLSTILGHSNPQHTFWYLSAVPELLLLASQRLEAAGRSRS